MSYNSPFTGTVIQPTDVSYREVVLTDNTQLEWPINGTATANYTARIMEVTSSASNLALYMPPADQTSVGNDVLLRNIGSNTFSVMDFGGNNTIITVAAGESKYIYITDNPDNEGTWGNIAFGVGSSSADAATLAGYGLVALATTLNQSTPVSTFSANVTATDAFRAQTYVWTGGAGTLTFDTTSALGNNWFMHIRNGGTGALTLSPSGGTLINGSASIVLQPTDSCMVVCSGTAFYTVGLGKSTLFNYTQLTKDVAAGGTFTLTSSEASNVIQKYTGTLAGNVTIVVPPTVQVYYIINDTVGGVNDYTITVTTGSGAVATISAGQQATLVCDSVNLFNANTVLAGSTTIALGNGNVGSPALSFASEGSTGVYRAAAGQFNIAILGVLRFTLAASGLTIVGGLTANSATLTGDVSAANATFSGGVTITGNVSANIATFSGSLTAIGGISGGTF